MGQDIKLLYLPTVDHLENYLYNDNFTAEVEAKHSIFKNLDLAVEYKSSDKTKMISVGMNSVNISLSNKEVH